MIYESILEIPGHLSRLTLQERSLFRIMTILCNNRQLLDLILKCNFKKDVRFRLSAKKGMEWEAVLSMANELVSQICHSVLLKKSIMELLWPVSCRIMMWKSIYAPSISKKFLKQFYWTDRGTIDNARTAWHIIENKNISAKRRFSLACSVCLVKEIHEIWRELSDDEKVYAFYVEDCERIFPLLRFWAHTIKGAENSLEQYINGASECAIKLGLLEALKYLFNLSKKNEGMCMSHILATFQTEFNFKLVESGCLTEDENEIIYFIFFEISDKDKKFIFDFLTDITLSLLLHASEYKLCLQLFVERLQTATNHNVLVFLSMIFYTYHLEISNNDECRKLFMDVWRIIPSSIRKCIPQNFTASEFVSVLVKDNFPFLFGRRAFEKIAELTSFDLQSSTSVKQFDFHQGKWKLLHFLIKEEVTTTTILEIYKEHLFFLLEIRPYNNATWIRLLRFVRKVRNNNSK